MKTLEFEGRKVIALENDDFGNWDTTVQGESIDVILVPKQHMHDFRETDVFHSLWESITDHTRIVYC